MIEVRRVASVVIAASVFSFAACKKDGEGGAGGAAAKAQAAGVSSVLATFPMDSDVIIGLDTAKLGKSFFADKLRAEMQDGIDLKECGIDPLAAGQVVLAMNLTSKQVHAGVSGWKKDVMMSCLEKSRGKVTAEGGEVTVDGNYAFVKSDDASFGLVWRDDATVLMTGGQGPAPSKATLDAMVGAKSDAGLNGSSEFASMFKAIDTRAGIWFLVRGNSPQLAMVPVKFKALFGSVDLSSGVAAEVRLRLSSSEEASDLVKGVSGQLGMVKALVTKLEVTAHGADVKVSVAVSPKQLEQLTDMVGALAGGMMGGMMEDMGGH
jgi:hypothetical protein